jgi:hypothetical protein
MEYQPERYLKDGKLNPDMLDPDSVAFGFGRRSVHTVYPGPYISPSVFPSICPGKHLSNNSLYLFAACFLAVYVIQPPVDDKGTIIKLKPEFTDGTLSSE